MADVVRLSLDDRELTHAELVAAKAQLVPADLQARLGDGRAVVRANAALGLAALGLAGREVVPFLRDGDPRVARAAAEALAHVGKAQKPHLVDIAAALDGARPEVVDIVQRMFADLVGQADAELITVLDTASPITASAVVGACARVGIRGLHLLQTAARDERARVRINAVRGIAMIGDLEQESSMEVLLAVEREDRVSDVRAATRAALGALRARCRAVVSARRKTVEPAQPAVPELEQRAMTPAELTAAAAIAPLDELVRALEVPRVHARLNAVRILALKGAADAPTARSLMALLRDPEDTVRVETAQALGKLGASAVVAAPELVRVLDDVDPLVVATAEATLAGLGAAAAPALVDGLDTPSEPRGARVAALIGRLADGASLLAEALASTSVDIRIHAATGLGALGKARAGAGALHALSAATIHKNARLRAAAGKAVALLDPRPDRAPPKVAIDGFETRALAEPELAAGKAALAAAGVAGLAGHLGDARTVVRVNAAHALGALGAEAAAEALAVALRDDAPEVRLAAARALDRLGEPAVVAAAPDLVRALRDADAQLATQIATLLRTRTSAAIDHALDRGLDTPDAGHAHRICEIACARPHGLDLLCTAFLRPTAQANAAHGLVMLGNERLGKGRALLEGARGDASVVTREIARTALRELDGPPAVPTIPAIAGFETGLLDGAAFAGATLAAADLLPFLQDGRAVVRANTATALGALGPAAAAGLATTIGALLRDDDDRVRVAAANALDRLGDDAVVAAAPYLVGALRGAARAPEVCKTVLAARTAKVEAALLAGLETPDEAHGLRIAELICALPNARELLFVAFDGPAQNVQINAALGIGLLGAKRAGPAGRQRLLGGLAGPITARRHAVVKALAMFGE